VRLKLTKATLLAKQKIANFRSQEPGARISVVLEVLEFRKLNPFPEFWGTSGIAAASSQLNGPNGRTPELVAPKLLSFQAFELARQPRNISKAAGIIETITIANITTEKFF
jgi:hypothetical protein